MLLYTKRSFSHFIGSAIWKKIIGHINNNSNVLYFMSIHNIVTITTVTTIICCNKTLYNIITQFTVSFLIVELDVPTG